MMTLLGLLRLVLNDVFALAFELHQALPELLLSDEIFCDHQLTEVFDPANLGIGILDLEDVGELAA